MSAQPPPLPTGVSPYPTNGAVVTVPEPPDPDKRLRERLEWAKWIGGSVVAIFVAGFVVAGLLNKYASKDELVKAQTADGSERSKLSARIQNVEDRIMNVRVSQARQEERTKLLDQRLQLLLERTAPAPRTTAARRARASRASSLERRVREQQQRVEAVEQDPLAGLQEDM